MAFEKTIAELNNIRNMEYERLRYDREVWVKAKGEMMAETMMDEAAKEDIRTVEELEKLEQDSRMAKFYGSKYHSNNIHATKEEVEKLGEYYKEEIQKHREEVKNATEKYGKQVDLLKEEIKKVLEEHHSKLAPCLRELANLQQDEKYVFDSVGIPEEWIVPGVGKYDEHFEFNVFNHHSLTKPGMPNFVMLYKNSSVFNKNILIDVKGEI